MTEDGSSTEVVSPAKTSLSTTPIMEEVESSEDVADSSEKREDPIHKMAAQGDCNPISEILNEFGPPSDENASPQSYDKGHEEDLKSEPVVKIPTRPRRVSAVAAMAAFDSQTIVSPARAPKKAIGPRTRAKVAAAMFPIQMIIGDRPDLKSILKPRNETAAAAKKVRKKYKNIKNGQIRRTKFHDKCSVRVITPLPGYVEGVVRLSASDDEDDSENPIPRLKNSICLTPDSRREFEEAECNGEPKEDLFQKPFNVFMVFGDEHLPPAKETTKDKKKRRVSTLPTQQQIMEHIRKENEDFGDAHIYLSPFSTMVEMPHGSDVVPRLQLEEARADTNSPQIITIESDSNERLVDNTEEASLQQVQKSTGVAGSANSEDQLRRSARVRRKSQFFTRSEVPTDQEPSASGTNVPPDNGTLSEQNHESAVIQKPTVEKAKRTYRRRSVDVVPKVNDCSDVKDVNTGNVEEPVQQGTTEMEVVEIEERKAAGLDPSVTTEEEFPILQSNISKSRHKKGIINWLQSTDQASNSSLEAERTTSEIFFRNDCRPANSSKKLTEPNSANTACSSSDSSISSKKEKPGKSKKVLLLFEKNNKKEQSRSSKRKTDTDEKPKPKRKPVEVDLTLSDGGESSQTSSVSDDIEVVSIASIAEEKQTIPRRIYHSEFDYAPFSSLSYSDPLVFNLSQGEEIRLPLRTSPIERCQHSTDVYVIPSSSVEAPADSVICERIDENTLEQLVERYLPGNYICRLSEREMEWFKRFDSCRETAETSCWSDAFRPKSSMEWIGDQSIAKQARKFLTSWKKKVTRDKQVSNKPKRLSGRSRKYSSDSDYEEEEELRLENPLILCGPSASGKTSLISALAEEFDMKILEVSPEDRRNGASLKAKISEATQSHRMHMNAISSFFTKPAASEKQGRTPKQTLVVIEQVDIFFDEQDKEFWPALKGIVQESRVPIIFTSDKWSLSDFDKEPKFYDITTPIVLNLQKPPLGLICSYVECLLLAMNSLRLSDTKKFVESHNGDLRSILLDLQFQLAHEGDTLRILNGRKFYAPRDINYTPPAKVYLDRMASLEDRRRQYSDVYDISKGPPHDLPARYFDVKSAGEALMNFSWSRPLVLDYLPMLCIVAKYEQHRSTTVTKRQFHHYLTTVRDEIAIDAGGDLLPLLPLFCYE